MEKIILANGFECEIKEGASINNITVVVDTFADLQPIAEALILEGNLSTVKFSSNDNITGEYSDMVLSRPIFRNVYKVDGKVEATFGLYENIIEEENNEVESEV